LQYISLLTLPEHLNWIKKKHTSNSDLELSSPDDMKEEGGICYSRAPRAHLRLHEMHLNQGAVSQNYLEI